MKNFFEGILELFDYSCAYSFYKYRLSRLLNTDIKDLDRLYHELRSSNFMKEMKRKTGIKTGFLDFSMLSVIRAPSLYVICRLLQPRIVVETGVCWGFSSAFILYALEKNKLGNLYSIDLPHQPGQEIPEGRNCGWLVPRELMSRWELIIGSSKDRLPILLQKLNQIDIFYHDSHHSYENMLFEFDTVWNFIKPTGLLLSDDITENKAFDYFCNLKNCSNSKLFKLGIIKKY